MLKIPLIHIRDKQAFRNEKGILRLIGKPLEVAKAFKSEGCRLIHIVDDDAIAGLPKNLDVYDGLTYVINVQVECAPEPSLVMKLLSLKCRVVLPPSADFSTMKERNLLVAMIPEGYNGEANGFHDVILQGAGDESVKRFHALGKRIIVYEKGYGKLSAGCQKLIWGVISSS